MVDVYHQWGNGMGVSDGGQGQNPLLQVPYLLSWLLLLFVPSLSLFLGNIIHAFFLFFFLIFSFLWRRNLTGLTGIILSDHNNYHHHLRAIFKLLSKKQSRQKSRVHGAIGFGFASHWLKNWRESCESLSVAIAIA